MTTQTGNATHNYITLNAMLKLPDSDGNIPFHKDREAARDFFLNHVNQNTVFFHTLGEKLQYLVDNGYYDNTVLRQYTPDTLKHLFQHAYSFKYRFPTFLGAYKFYQHYALKTVAGDRFLERFEDRVVMNALYLAQGDEGQAETIITEIITNRMQPATPTFLNAGKQRRGEHVSCFLIRVEDSMTSIANAVTASLQLSRKGGGVGILLTNIREMGAPIKGIENAASGVIPVMKILEDSFSYANQLGSRQGAGAVYISCHHPDIMRFLDTKRENADEKIRIKTLSMGVMVSDKAFELAKHNKDLYLFSPQDVQQVFGKPMSDVSIDDHYDDMVNDPRIRKTKINARQLFQTIAEISFESGYPYLVFENHANMWNPIPGRINMSNLCSEILQTNTPSHYDEHTGEMTVVGKDISCNLASINIHATMCGGDIQRTVDTTVRALTTVSDTTDIAIVPTVANGNRKHHSIGVGAMNLHGFLGSHSIEYGSDEALDFVNVFFATMRYHALNTSADIAKHTGVVFEGFHQSDYYSGDGETPKALQHYTSGVWETHPHTPKVAELFEHYNQWFPSRDDWCALAEKIRTHGLYHAYLMAVAPTGNISYVASSTSSLTPIPDRIEVRKEGKVGRVYYPAPGLTNSNKKYYKDAYELGVKPLIDTYAVAGKHVDQGLSLTMFFKDTHTTRDLNRAYVYAWSKPFVTNEYGEVGLFDPRTSWKHGVVKTLYYSRIRQEALEGTEVVECASCVV